MRISFMQPRPELQPYVESFWIYESHCGMPPADTSMAAPNGCPKLIIPYENSLISIADGRTRVTNEGGMYFVGNWDTPTLLRASARKTGFVTIEFSPHGAFPFFGIPMDETANGLFDSKELFGKWGRQVRDRLSNLDKVDEKVSFIQDRSCYCVRGRGTTVSLSFALRLCGCRVGVSASENWNAEPAILGGTWTSSSISRSG